MQSNTNQPIIGAAPRNFPRFSFLTITSKFLTTQILKNLRLLAYFSFSYQSDLEHSMIRVKGFNGIRFAQLVRTGSNFSRNNKVDGLGNPWTIFLFREMVLVNIWRSLPMTWSHPNPLLRYFLGNLHQERSTNFIF